MLSDVHSLNLKLYCKKYNKIDLLNLIVVPQVSGGLQNNYSGKTRPPGHANEESFYYLMSMALHFSWLMDGLVMLLMFMVDSFVSKHQLFYLLGKNTVFR
jgi:hypothetical protein